MGIIDQVESGTNIVIRIDADKRFISIEGAGDSEVIRLGAIASGGQMTPPSSGLRIHNKDGAAVVTVSAADDVTSGEGQGHVFVRDGSGRTTIHLSGGSGGARFGADGQPGNVELTDERGEITIGLDGSSGASWMATVMRAGGQDTGWVALSNARQQETVLLGGETGVLQLRDDNGTTTISLAAAQDQSANLIVGGPRRSGWAVMRSADGQDAALLSGHGGDGLLELRNEAGSTMISLHGNRASAWLGGQNADGTNGADGDVLVLAKDAAREKENASVWIRGDVGDIVLRNADCAEDFEVEDSNVVTPGAVLALNDRGLLEPADQPFDRRVVGVISGGGGLRPGIVLGRSPGASDRWPIALSGKVFCQADASYAPIEVGDLLTTSATAGHAMAVRDAHQAFGAVLGKALGPLQRGQALIPILVALQ